MHSDATQLHQEPRSVEKPLRRVRLTAALGLFFVVGLGFAGLNQARAAAVAVTDTTGWIAWTNGSGLIADPGGDQQTGQGTDDFIGNQTTAAFQQMAGTISGVQSILFRARMGKYSASGFGAGNGANFSIGVDLNDNGSIDLIIDMNSKGSVNTVSFAQPGTGANTGPSTTSWGNFAGSITLDSSTYDYQNATAVDGIVLNSDGTSAAGTENGDTATSYTANSWVTFALSYANLQAAIRAYAKDGLAGETFAGYVLDDLSHLSFIAFTSTQGNAINQDLLGTEGNMNSSLTFAQLGASTDYIRPGGGPIPEPAAFYQMGGLLGTGLIVWAWRRKRRQASGPAQQD